MAELETPDDPESIYLARQEDVGEHRPAFTGDVYQVADDGHLVMILQHPCALRRGVKLNPKLLVAPVGADTLRSNWANFTVRRMPLPKLIDEQDHSADFVDLELLHSPTLPSCQRIAVLSQSGVNLLMQRWAYHNTRLVVPTSRLIKADEQTSIAANTVDSRSYPRPSPSRRPVFLRLARVSRLSRRLGCDVRGRSRVSR